MSSASRLVIVALNPPWKYFPTAIELVKSCRDLTNLTKFAVDFPAILCYIIDFIKLPSPNATSPNPAYNIH